MAAACSLPRKGPTPTVSCGQDQSTTNKRKEDEGDFITSRSPRDSNNPVEKEITERDKIFADQVSDKKLESRIHKEV